MKIHISINPQEIINAYNLQDIVDDKGFVYTNIGKVMYGLKQAGIIAHNEVVKHLAPHGYQPVRYTPGLWKHDTCDTMFTLVVDNFSIKYTPLDNAHHLLDALKTNYTISEDWEAHLYIGIALKWD